MVGHLSMQSFTSESRTEWEGSGGTKTRPIASLMIVGSGRANRREADSDDIQVGGEYNRAEIPEDLNASKRTLMSCQFDVKMTGIRDAHTRVGKGGFLDPDGLHLGPFQC